MSTQVITEQELRIWGKDKAELNPLLDGVRFTPEDIEQACINVVDYFNILTPPTLNSYSVQNFPSRALLCLGVWGWLLMGAAINQASNELEYSTNGVSIQDNNKAQIFTSLGDRFWQEFKDIAKNIKLTQNIAAVYGTNYSEYSYR